MNPSPRPLWFVAARMFLLLQMPGNTYDWRYLLDQHGTQDQEDNPDLYQRMSVIVCVVLTSARLLDRQTVAVLNILLE